MPFYLAHGLVVESPLVLSGLPEADHPADVHVRFEEAAAGNGHPLDTSLSLGPAECSLSIADVGVFCVRNGRDVRVRIASKADEPTLSRFLTGSVMALLLHQRGLLAIHASCVVVDDSAVLFIGEPGLGKSSLAAALHRRGHTVLSDDLTAICLSEAVPTVLSCANTIKLYPAIADFLGYNSSSMTLLSQDERAKVGVCIHSCLSCKRPALKRIYTLSRLDTGLDRLSPQQAFLDLIPNSYPTRLLHPGNVGHFRLCGQLAGQVPIFRLPTFETLGQLLDTSLAVETHVREQSL